MCLSLPKNFAGLWPNDDEDMAVPTPDQRQISARLGTVQHAPHNLIQRLCILVTESVSRNHYSKTIKVVEVSIAPSMSERVQALFNRIAPHYDLLNSLLSLGLHQRWKQQAVQWTQVPAGGLALDICCGSGDLALELAAAVGPQGRVIGVDFAADMLAIARQRSHTVIWLSGDALQLPLDRNRFDAVTMGYGLRNVGNIPQALAEIWRVLKPGGICAILDFQRLDPNDPRYWLQQSYLNTVVVPCARLLGIAAEYDYISQSLVPFPNSSEQVALAAAVGFINVCYQSLTLDLMGVLVAQKPL